MHGTPNDINPYYHPVRPFSSRFALLRMRGESNDDRMRATINVVEQQKNLSPISRWILAIIIRYLALFVS
jgi:hypothetical protein